MFTYLFERDFSDTISRIILLTLVAVLPFMGGCGEDENPIIDDPDHDHEMDAPLHADADGFNLEIDGEVVYHQHQGHQEGGLTVHVGQEIEIHVHFLDADENELHLDEVAPPPGADEQDDHDHDHDGLESFSLGLTGYDSSIIKIHLDEHDHEGEEHDDDGEDHEHEDDHEEHADALPFGIEGLKAGKTEIKLQLLHGDHPDFTAALPIPVTVE